MVGLHCCGNLTPNILRLFVSGFHPALRSLVLIGCCYHKMSPFSMDTTTAGGIYQQWAVVTDYGLTNEIAAYWTRNMLT